MVVPRFWIRGALCLVLCTNVTRAGLLVPVRRDDSSTTTAAAATTTGDTSPTQTTASSETTASKDAQSSSDESSSSITVTSSTSSATMATAAPSALNGNTVSNTSTVYSNTTIAEGELPLQPRITPGWGVAGAILIIAGAIHALIGIKNNYLHTFLSTSFLVGLCTAILIVYVMVLPASDAVQGAYVVACVCTGAILGGAATVFKELTESLGCLLGGFCFAMWLLTLHGGGLVTNTSGKIIFIIAFTFAGFALYFSRHTRGYALIWAISFSGATATVLGIDCFSRAGLKEFWAYIWALNDDLFPLGADTYPLTKGIRVEIALIVLIFLVGMISQLKLWRVIQDHRTKRAETRAEAQQQREIEEANVGQQIEAQDAVDRRQWEATYGGKDHGSLYSSKDSGIGDMTEKKSQTITRQTPVDGDDVIELSDLPNPHDEFVDVDLSKPDDEGRTVVRVAEEDHVVGAADPASAAQESTWVVGADGEPKRRSVALQRNSQRLSRVFSPNITPLPFQIPDTEEMDGEDDRSSFATFADDDDRSMVLDKRASRASLSNRLSIGSGHLLRSISRGSLRSTQSKRKSGGLSPTGLSHEWTGSREDLVSGAKADDAGSIAATIDGLSEDGNDETEKQGDPDFALHITAELNDEAPNVGSSRIENTHKQMVSPTTGKFLAPRPYSVAETVGTDILNSTENGQLSDPKVTTPKSPRSAVPSTRSTSAALTKASLPAGLPRVASTYRTNEWAKHLSLAETPEPENLRVSQYQSQEEAAKDTEVAAPVKLEELQQTAQNATPPPALARSPSSMSQSPLASGHVSRSNSRLSVVKGQGPTITAPGPPSVHATRGFKRSSVNPGQHASDVSAEPIAEEQANTLQAEPQDGLVSGQESPASANYSQPGLRPPVAGVVSYASPQTLLGKREMLIRNKSSIMGLPTPDSRASIQQPPASESGSIRNYPSYSSLAAPDADDIPLSQRKQLIRQSSVLSAQSLRPSSNIGVPYSPGQPSHTMNEASNFDSHQPMRHSVLPSQQARDVRLASFRDSVAHDTRAASPATATNGFRSSRDILPSQLQYGGLNGQDIQRSVDQSRNMLLNQRGQEMQRKEMERLQKEHNDRVFEESMRSNPHLMDAHRDAMRRMQGSAR